VQGISSVLKFVIVVSACILLRDERSKAGKERLFQNNAYMNFYNDACLAIKGKEAEILTHARTQVITT
jgi:hypothetical protein